VRGTNVSQSQGGGSQSTLDVSSDDMFRDMVAVKAQAVREAEERLRIATEEMMALVISPITQPTAAPFQLMPASVSEEENQPLIVYSDIGCNSSVLFDPRKCYYLAYFNDLSSVLIYGFAEETLNPFFSKQKALDKESLAEKRRRIFYYLNPGPHYKEVTEVLLTPYSLPRGDEDPRPMGVLRSFDQLLLREGILNSTAMAECGYENFQPVGSVTIRGARELGCGPINIELSSNSEPNTAYLKENPKPFIGLFKFVSQIGRKSIRW